MIHRRGFCQSALASAVAAALPANRLLAAAHEIVDKSGTPIRAVTGDGAPVELSRSAPRSTTWAAGSPAAC